MLDVPTHVAHGSSMLPAHGDPSSPIWLIGDSAPEKTAGVRHPLDVRHPTRHTIWTSVLDSIQDALFRHADAGPRRLADSAVYTSNAVLTAACKTDAARTSVALRVLRERFALHAPTTVITFGRDAFQLAVVAMEGGAPADFRFEQMSLGKMRRAFDARVGSDRRVVPLLHQIVALQFDRCHAAYASGDHDSYYHYCGAHLAQRLLRLHPSSRDAVWVQRHCQE